MDEDTLNLQIRKFLKKVGITSQREIERAIQAGLAQGKISGNETLKASVTLSMPALGLSVSVDDDIALE